MTLRRGFMAMLAVAGLALAAIAAEDDSEAGGVPLPDIARGQGENCVEDTDFMRRNHMNLLMHQRDDTMRQGIRSKRHSLRECINCHVVDGPDAKPVTAASPKHFCSSCHEYAAVKIDCFDCHASRPDPQAVAGDHDAAVTAADEE